MAIAAMPRSQSAKADFVSLQPGFQPGSLADFVLFQRRVSNPSTCTGLRERRQSRGG